MVLGQGLLLSSTLSTKWKDYSDQAYALTRAKSVSSCSTCEQRSSPSLIRLSTGISACQMSGVVRGIPAPATVMERTRNRLVSL